MSSNRDDNLTGAEAEQLAKLEAIVQRGLGTYTEVRDALGRIALAQLYRDTHPTFASYLVTRWGIAQPLRVYQIQAAPPALEPSELAPRSAEESLVARLRWLLTQSAGHVANVAHQLEIHGGELDAGARKMLKRDVVYLEEEVIDVLGALASPVEWDAELGRLLDGEIAPFEGDEDE